MGTSYIRTTIFLFTFLSFSSWAYDIGTCSNYQDLAIEKKLNCFCAPDDSRYLDFVQTEIIKLQVKRPDIKVNIPSRYLNFDCQTALAFRIKDFQSKNPKAQIEIIRRKMESESTVTTTTTEAPGEKSNESISTSESSTIRKTDETAPLVRTIVEDSAISLELRGIGFTDDDQIAVLIENALAMTKTFQITRARLTPNEVFDKNLEFLNRILTLQNQNLERVDFCMGLGIYNLDLGLECLSLDVTIDKIKACMLAYKRVQSNDPAADALIAENRMTCLKSVESVESIVTCAEEFQSSTYVETCNKSGFSMEQMRTCKEAFPFSEMQKFDCNQNEYDPIKLSACSEAFSISSNRTQCMQLDASAEIVSACDEAFDSIGKTNFCISIGTTTEKIQKCVDENPPVNDVKKESKVHSCLIMSL